MDSIMFDRGRQRHLVRYEQEHQSGRSQPARRASSADASLDVLRATLATHTLELCRDILPNGIRQGNEWRVGSIYGEKGLSLAVHLTRPRAGWWADFNGGEDRGRDLLSLIARVKCGGDFREAIRWARRWLGDDDRREAAVEREIERRPANARVKLKAVDQEKIARELFFKSCAELIGTPVEAYLSERAIGLRDLPRRPHFLRYEPRLWHSPSRRTWPGMIAAVVDQHGKFLACHRTYLAISNGIVGKAPVDSQKMMLGRYLGGTIPVWPGSSGAVWPKITPGETIAITEGIEDALSLAVMLPDWRVVAAGSVGNLPRIVLPPGFSRVVIAAQNDPCFDARGDVHSVLAALDGAVRNFRRQGVEVGITRPRIGKDFNDWLVALSRRRDSEGWDPPDRGSARIARIG